MKNQILKVEKGSLTLSPVTDVPVWKGSNILEAFGPDGRTKMSAGIHEIFPSEVTCTVETDDVLYILEGELEVEVNGEKRTFLPGDFAYLFNRTKVTIRVAKYDKHVYFPTRLTGKIH